MMDIDIKQHWKILETIQTKLPQNRKIREFMAIGDSVKGLLDQTVLVATSPLYSEVATEDDEEDGQGYWFGEMKFGNQSRRTSTTEPTLLDVPPGLIEMAHGDGYILLLNKRGEIYSMGQNFNGQLGLGSDDENGVHFKPRLISIPHTRFISVRCGTGHSLALTDDGKCWAWGLNEDCQLGLPNNSTNFISSPRQIPELDPHRVISVECGHSHSLALTDQGEVYAWGNNWQGQLCCPRNNGKRSSSQPIPTRISTHEFGPVKSIAAGQFHTLLLTRSGEVYTSGRNERFKPLNIPVTTPHLTKVSGLPSCISQIASHPESYMSIVITSYRRCYILDHLTLSRVIIPRKLPLSYKTLESPFPAYLNHNPTHSVTVPETSPPSPQVSATMSQMLDNPETSDFQFVVEQRTIHAHQNILSISSGYFARMFSEKWLVPVDPAVPILRVNIPDYSYAVFHAFLRFLYNDYQFEVNDFAILPELFQLATLYLVPELKQFCIAKMHDTLSTETCCLYYPVTKRHSLPELEDFQEDLVQFASSRMSEVVATEAYQSMEPDIRDKLNSATRYFPSD